MNPIPSHWVFSFKVDEKGETKAKARLVARGDHDETAYGENEVYSPVCSVDSLPVLLSSAVKF